jgi:hypothetical protein
MTTPTGSEPGSAMDPGEGGPDWTDQVTDLVVDSIDKVRARTTGPVMNVSKASVYVVVALIVALPITVALMAGMVRLLNWAIPGDVWIAYAIMAVLFFIGGAVMWSRRDRSTP